MLGTLLDTKVVGLPLEGSMQGWIVILIVTSKQNKEEKKENHTGNGDNCTV